MLGGLDHLARGALVVSLGGLLALLAPACEGRATTLGAVVLEDLFADFARAVGNP